MSISTKPRVEGLFSFLSDRMEMSLCYMAAKDLTNSPIRKIGLSYPYAARIPPRGTTLSNPFTITARCSLVLPFLLLLSACASYEPSAVDVTRGPAEIYTDSANGMTVSTTILSDALAQSLYGVDLANSDRVRVGIRRR